MLRGRNIQVTLSFDAAVAATLVTRIARVDFGGENVFGAGVLLLLLFFISPANDSFLGILFFSIAV